MHTAADRGGPFGRGGVRPGATVPRNWMRAKAPGIAFRRLPVESSPVGSGGTALENRPRDRQSALACVAALGLGLALWLTRDRVS